MGSTRTASTGAGSRAAAEDLMRAIAQDAYGTTEVLRLAEIAKPVIAANEVLVKVGAAGMDRGTWHMMTGQPYLLRIMGFGFRKPKNRVPGLDVAGTVAAIGAEVTRFKIGDEVFGVSRGSFAEYAAALESKLALKPVNVSFEQAAVLGVSATVALRALRDSGHVEAGQKVLILGASGGVGTYAVQLAKAFGAEVTGVSSAAKLDLVRSLGADHALDYASEDFADGAHHYDLILDIGGNSRLSKLRQALTAKGTVVIIGGEEGGKLTGGFGRSLRAPLLSLVVGQRLVMFITKENSVDLKQLGQFIESGQLTPMIDKTYSLCEVRDAMRHLQAGHARGKLAIRI